MTCEEIVALIDLRAIGALDGDDARRVDAHLETGCASCRAALSAAESELALVALGSGDPPAGPGIGVESGVLRAVLRRRRLARAGLAAAALLVATSLAGGAYFLGAARGTGGDGGTGVAVETERLLAEARRAAADLRVELEAERANRTRLAAELGEAEAEIARYEEDLLFLSSPETVVVPLSGAGGGRGLVGRAYFDPSTGETLVYAFVPPVGAERVYQLWFLSDSRERAQSGGTFTRQIGERGLRVKAPSFPIGGALTLAITLEPEGGSPKPSGTFLVEGRLR